MPSERVISYRERFVAFFFFVEISGLFERITAYVLVMYFCRYFCR